MSQMREAHPAPVQPPPPPPPPCPSFLEPVKKSQNERIVENSKIKQEEVENCLKRLLSSEERLKRTFYTCNTFLRPQLQDGPQCGLVALSIATSATENFVNVESLFKKAQAHGFTRQGEIFDARFLAVLAEECGFKVNVIEGGLNKHLGCIIKSLLNNCLVLVPYDADFNHGPCCKNGHKAHWAVICGFVIFHSTGGDDGPQGEEEDFVLLNTEDELCDCAGPHPGDAPLSFSVHRGGLLLGKKSRKDVGGGDNFGEGAAYLIGMQGKSRHAALWPFRGMAESNGNLVSLSTSRDAEAYVVPEGGLPEGLRGRAVVLYSAPES